ncbi:ferredoxin--NADP reductase [bacterium]|nr:ferredoxin--NADP reductase [bacterium]
MPDTDHLIEARAAYNATITSFKFCNPDLAIIRVRPDDGVPEYKPGQYTTLGLLRGEARAPECQDDPYEPGEAGKMVKRAYSICHPVFSDADPAALAPHPLGYLEFFIVLIREAAPDKPPLLTPRLFALSEGSRIFCAPRVVGKYTLDTCAEDMARHGDDLNLVFVSTGTGEAPHHVMIWDLLRRGFKGRLFSIMCSRYRADMGYANMHRRLAELYPNYDFVEITTRDTPGRKMYIQSFVEEGHLFERHAGFADPARTHYYLCGNPAMIGLPTRSDGTKTYPATKGLVEVLENLGFAADHKRETGNIHFEEYW